MHRRFRRPNFSSLSTPSIPSTTNTTINFSSDSIETTVTIDASVVDQWIQTVRSDNEASEIIVGLDCEWRPNFSRYSCNRVALLQLCVGNKCLVLQLYYMDSIPQSLKDFLLDEAINFVGIGIGEDVRKLRNDYGISCVRFTELDRRCNEYLGIIWSKQLGLRGYAREILGMNMEKSKRVTMSNWELRSLSDAQIRYATVDAYVSCKLGSKVLESS